MTHKKALFSYLRERWRTLFDVRFDVLLYDLTSTYFEYEPSASEIKRYGYKNASSHTYDEQTADQLTSAIIDDYFPLFVTLQTEIEKYLP